MCKFFREKLHNFTLYVYVMSFDQQFLTQMFYIFVWLLWLYSILRVARDIAQRTQNSWMQFFSVAWVIFLTPIVGVPLYFLMRPHSLQYDEYRREQMVVESIACVFCQQRNPREFEFCTFCWEKLKNACRQCHKPYALSYEYCPFCGGPNIES